MTIRNKPAGSYWYRVRACNNNGCSDYSPTLIVNVGQGGSAPATPAPPNISPADPCPGDTYTISWNAVTNATSYELYENGSLIYQSSGTSTTRSNQAGTYGYQVRACNAHGCSSSSGTTNVTIGGCEAPATPPTPSAPASACSGATYTVSWSQVAEATSYRLYETGTLVYEGSSLSYSTSHSSGSHSYRLAAGNEHGWSGQSSPRTVQIIFAVSGTTTVSASTTTPQPGETYTISWQQVSGATQYQLYENGSVVYTGSATSRSFSKSAGSYEYRVRAGNSCGYGGYSNTVTVAVQQATTYTISGRIVDGDGLGVEGVTVAGLPGPPITDPEGDYTATVAAGWSGSAVPELAGYTFTPTSIEFSDVTSHMSDQDFTADFGGPCLDPVCFAFTSQTGNSYSIVINSVAAGGGALAVCDEIAVFDGDLCVGAVVWDGEWPLALVAWENDSQTPEIDGYQVGNALSFKLARATDCVPVALCPDEFGWAVGDGTFGNGPFTQVGLVDDCCREFSIELESGWNYVSVNTVPPELDILTILEPVLPQVQLIKQCDGAFCIPDLICDVEDWDVLSAYQIYMQAPGTVNYCGLPVPCDEPIALDTGWNCLAYLPPDAVDAEVALAGIVDCLTIIKAPDGLFYIPDVGNFIGDLVPGLGYQAYMSCATDLVYDCGVGMKSADGEPAFRHIAPRFFAALRPTQEYHAVVVKSGSTLSPGDEIGVFDGDGRLVGVGVYTGDSLPIAVWADDAATDVVDGMRDGEGMELRLWRQGADAAVTVAPFVLSGSLIFGDSAYTMLSIPDQIACPTRLSLSFQPNPFNPFTTISFAPAVPGLSQLTIYNLRGQRVKTLVHDDLEPGEYEVQWDGRDENGRAVASGVYLCRLENAGASLMKRMTLMK